MLTLRLLHHALGGNISNGELLCAGPGHSPKDRSLSIKLDGNAPDGFIVHSFAGDDAIVCRDYVRGKAGLEPFTPNSGNGRQRASEAAIERALMAAVAMSNADKPKARVVAKYNYTDADAILLYQVVRLEPKSAGFRQRRPDGNGDWIWNLNDVPRVPYLWPELLKFPDATVFVCEGEKDSDRVASLGHCATTVASGKWTEDCARALTGRDIIILQDKDDKHGGEPGRTKALNAAAALHGVAKTIRIVLLPDLGGDINDVSDWLDQDLRRAERLVDVCFDVPIWTPAQPAPELTPPVSPPPASSIAPPSPSTSSANIVPLPFINIAAWHGAPVPEWGWVVRDRVPLATVTLLSGDGGVGKTILALHLGAATALGHDWLNALPEPGPVLMVCCEDDGDELHRRLDRIVGHYNATCGATFEELGRDMHLVTLASDDAVMAAPNKSNGLIAPTMMFKRLHSAACDIRPRLIVIDNSADVFAGNENDRAHVRQFITMLRGMAINCGGAGLLLTSHPSLTGISTGTGLSGSTAWNASVRSRLYFKRATTEKDEEPDPDLRVLEVMKANYGPVGETVMVQWKGGLFLPVAGISSMEKLAAEQKADDLFLELLDEFQGQGRNVSYAKNAHNYAPTMFGKDPKAKAPGMRQALADAMERLFAAKRIKVETYGRSSHPHSRITRC
jgi:RecA-family ATPase